MLTQITTYCRAAKQYSILTIEVGGLQWRRTASSSSAVSPEQESKATAVGAYRTQIIEDWNSENK